MSSTLPQPPPRDEGLQRDGDGRWEMIRDVVILQLKLIIEGIRDVVLGPIAILSGLLGLARRDGDPAHYFHRLLRAGYRFDDWLNLYGPLARLPEEDRKQMLVPPEAGVDRYFERVERALVEQYERGGLTRTAKEQIDTVMDLARGDRKRGRASRREERD